MLVDPLGLLVHQVNLEKPVLVVTQDPLVAMAPQVPVVMSENAALMVNLARRALLVPMVLLVNKVPLAPLALLVLVVNVVQQERLGKLEPRVKKVTEDP